MGWVCRQQGSEPAQEGRPAVLVTCCHRHLLSSNTVQLLRHDDPLLIIADPLLSNDCRCPLDAGLAAGKNNAAEISMLSHQGEC